jgi:hypothetical protein
MNPWQGIELVAVRSDYLSHSILSVLSIKLLCRSVCTNVLEVEPDLIVNLEAIGLLSLTVCNILLVLLGCSH